MSALKSSCHLSYHVQVKMYRASLGCKCFFSMTPRLLIFPGIIFPGKREKIALPGTGNGRETGNKNQACFYSNDTYILHYFLHSKRLMNQALSFYYTVQKAEITENLSFNLPLIFVQKNREFSEYFFKILKKKTNLFPGFPGSNFAPVSRVLISRPVPGISRTVKYLILVQDTNKKIIFVFTGLDNLMVFMIWWYFQIIPCQPNVNALRAKWPVFAPLADIFYSAAEGPALSCNAVCSKCSCSCCWGGDG